VNLITNKLKEEELLKDPIVLVEFLNFKISILGEVNRVGQFNVSGDRLTLLDAIAMAGDLTRNARLDRIAVIREYGNKRRIMWNDIRTKDIFTSPSYYLQQNDIVYVETNGRRAEQDVQRRFSFWHTMVYSISSVISLIVLITKL
jgi:polysaccharide export outer membrane protein